MYIDKLHQTENLTAILIAIFTISSLNSCDSNSTVSPNDSSNDELLTKLLVSSTFDDDRRTINYKSDHTFVEKHYRYNEYDDKILWYKRTGRYKVKESILYTTDVEIDDNLYANKLKGPFSIIFFDTELSLVHGHLRFNRISVLNQMEGAPNDIWGTWETTRWAFHYTGHPETNYQGRERYFYTFNKDSSKVHYGWEYIDEKNPHRIEFDTDFEYDPPHLELSGPAEYNINVSFKDGKMYWRY